MLTPSLKHHKIRGQDCSVEKLHIVHYFRLALYFGGLYIMKDEYNHQIATEGADAGYDSEANHRYAREVLGIKTAR